MNGMNRYSVWFALMAMVVCSTSITSAGDVPDPTLKVVIIRHAEKPDDGDNLSCQGMDRALKLPKVLFQKFQTPNHTYVPSLDCDKATKHSRMFQTISPFAVKYNLKINSKYGETDFAKVAPNVLEKKGTVLMVWEHSAIQPLAKALGVADAPAFAKKDFDSIWIITFPNGQAKLDFDREGITPAADCPF
jgi:hypothetical protein